MPPVGLAVLLLCFVGIITTYSIQQRHYNDELNMRLDGTYALFNKLLQVETDVLESLASTYVDNASLGEAFLGGDRELLLQETEPILEKIKQRFKITHFYFHLPDKTCFLRVHNPPRHGDLVARHTMNFAAKNNTHAYGLELGPLGTLTLRFVIPWHIDGELVGFIELGKEIDQIAEEMKKILELEINFIVEKKFLNAEDWREGRRMLGREKGDWDFLAEHVVISTTMARLPEDLQQILNDPNRFHYGEVFSVASQKGSYRGVTIPLSEAGIKNIGAIIVLRDFKKISSSNQRIIMLSLLTFMALIVLMLLLYSYLGRIETDLTDIHNSLQNEIREHEQTEQKLAVQHEQLDQLVEERTEELERALAEVKILSGFLPICASCKDIRTESGEWEQIESYIRDHSEAQFSHSYCPKCAAKLYKDFRR
ncbi:MAG: cache domain-containing protein [Desulfurivibrionaceae bacterium]|nr:cache domain-containing protein [Desulfurivibrionaceae bacterium]